MATEKNAEFDRYAKDYGDLHAESIRLSGETPEYFARYKAQEVSRCSTLLPTDPDARVLDFGCGIGGTIPHLAKAFPAASIHGVDVSEESLAFASEKHADKASFANSDGSRLPYQDASFDLVFTSCVFHHIEPNHWVESLREIHRVLKPGGEFFFFEHNPWNPVTRKVVRECPFDEHAVLLDSRTATRLMREAGFASPRTRYTLFFPHSLSIFRPLERFMGAIPIGAQYFIRATAKCN